MNVSLFDGLMMIGVVCSALAIAVTCMVGLVVWLAGGERRYR